MHRKLFSLFLTLLLVGALAALAQSPTSSNTGGSETKDPYGATLDHPNPGSPNPARPAPAPATAMTTPESTTAVTPPAATTPEPTTAATPPATSTYNSSTTSNDSMATGATTPSTTSASPSLPRTASDLPLLVIIGLLALGGALTVRSIAQRNA